MSGFVVVYRLDGDCVSEEALARMQAPLIARGPDDVSRWRSGPLAVASTLLSTSDSRPDLVTTRLGEHMVAGQVRLDGRNELIALLRGSGRRVTEEDADIVLFAHAWDAWDVTAFDRILGDFSVVVVNETTRTCTLARDPFGVRMLFYSATAERIVASNTLDAVRAAPGVSGQLDDDALADFIAVGMNENLASTSFRDVRRVPPGSFVRLARGRPSEVVRYWTIPSSSMIAAPRDYAEHFRTALEDSVRDRCRGGSVSVSMSGGLDSTSLAAVARRVLPGSAIVTGITIDLPAIAPSPDVLNARLVALHCGLSHRVFNADQFGVRDGLDHDVYCTPEPYDDTELSSWRAFLLEARASSPVMLYGEDPDALLAPPDFHEQVRAQHVLRVGWSVLSYLLREGSRPHLGFRNTFRRVIERRRGHAAEEVGPAWLRADLRARRRDRLAARTPATHRTRGEVARRLANPRWQSVLESLDAGHHGVPIDIRLPFLDLRVVESALAAPAIPWLQRKRLLRDAMRGLLPDAVRLAPKRALDGFPEGRVQQWWSRNPHPFAPSDQLLGLLERSAIPIVTRGSSAADVLAHLRLRHLDRWLRDAIKAR